MKFIDLTTGYKLTKERISIAVSTTVTLLLCAVGSVVVATSFNRHSDLEISERDMQASLLYEQANDALESSSAASVSESIEESVEASISEYIASQTNPMPAVSSRATQEDEDTDGTDEDDTDNDADGADTDDTDGTEDNTETTETAAATTTTSNEQEFYSTVYATQTVNLRTGPGLGYDIVRELAPGAAIDTVALTNDGWYRTFNGNYVLAELTTSTPPATTTTTTAAATTTTAATAAATTTTAAPATTTTTTAFTETPSGADTSGMTYIGSCTVTFYSPYHMGDGSYNVSTATGTTCCQGRTVAADWSILPAGTTIYVANDPLGGDGYYTVEDRGSAVIGNHIDIFADDISSLSTTTRDVYIVN